jgi:hypothetical protein
MSPTTAGWSTPATGASATARARATACCWPRRTTTGPPSTGCGAGPASPSCATTCGCSAGAMIRRPGRPTDPNNATDGDILIAWALLRASRRWKEQSYATDSRAIREAIAQNLVADVGGRRVLLPGLVGFRQQDAVDLQPVVFRPAGAAGLRRRRSRRPVGTADPGWPHRGARRSVRSAVASRRLGPDRRFRRRHARSRPSAALRLRRRSRPAVPGLGRCRTRFRRPRPPASGDDTRERAGRPPPGSTCKPATRRRSPCRRAGRRWRAWSPTCRPKGSSPRSDDYYSAVLGLLAERAAQERRSRGASQRPVRP